MGYYGNRRFAFDYRGTHMTSFVRYGIMHLAGFGLNYAMLLVFVDRWGYPHQLVQGAAILIVASFLFLSFNFFVFPQPRNLQEPSCDSRRP